MWCTYRYGEVRPSRQLSLTSSATKAHLMTHVSYLTTLTFTIYRVFRKCLLLSFEEGLHLGAFGGNLIGHKTYIFLNTKASTYFKHPVLLEV
jgi:hypothetical protein